MQGITDQRVLSAIERTPRDLFVDEPFQATAYENIALPIACGQTISQPYIVAYMTETLEIEQKHRVVARALDEQPKTLFAFAQCFLGPFAVCYVVEAIDRADDLALFVLDRARRDQNIAASAILLLDQNFKVACL